MGDPSKLLVLEAILDVIQTENLLQQATDVGNYTLRNLLELEKEFPYMINSSRGRGTFIAFNCATPEHRDSLVKKLLAKGTLYKLLKI